MSFYLLRNGIVGGKRVCNANNTVCAWLNGVAPGSDFLKLERDQEEEIRVPISSSEIVRITNTRSTHLLKEHVPTLARGEADFISFATLNQFFEQAVRRSASVCQLLKKCSDDDTNNFVEAFKDKLYSRDQLRSLLYDAKIEDDFWNSLPKTFEELENTDTERLKARITEAQKAKPEKGPEGFCIPAGTGFLVGRGYLLTNNHVLPDPESAKDFIARFRYDRNDPVDSTYLEFPPVDYQLDPSLFASSSPNQLDYTLIKLKPLDATSPKRGLNFIHAGDNFGWLPLFEDDALIAPPLSKEAIRNNAQLTDKLDQELKAVADLFGLAGEPVDIIQHPRGRAKEIVFYSNRVQQISKKYIQYEADTDLGSSGSPVLNGQWQTVALHRAVLFEEKDDNINVLGSLGIRTCAIAKHMKDEYAKVPEIRKFIEEFVIPKDNYDKPRGTVFILAQVSKKDLDIHISEKIVSQMTNSITSIAEGIKEAEVSSDFEHKKVLSDFGYKVEVIPIPPGGPKSDGEIIYDWLKNPPNFRVGDIAIYITMDAYTIGDPNSDEPSTIKKVVENDCLRGVGVFYAGNRTERQAQAQLFLQNLLNQELKQQPSSKQPKLEQPESVCKNTEQPRSVYKKTISLALPNRGVKTDLTFIQEPEDEPTPEQRRQLPFTRSSGIPSLILRLGFITNSKDREAIIKNKEDITQGIACSLLVWGNSINPVPMEAYLLKEAGSPTPDQSAEKATDCCSTTNLLPSADILSRFSL